MCGIAGFWGTPHTSSANHVVGLMSGAIEHRGPDDAGSWLDADVGIALGHRRLAVVDLSAAGHQPMHSNCQRYVISYNGEIYNHQEIRDALEQLGAAPPWRGHSDTETLLAAISHWGVTEALTHLNGMFAFALWDKAQQQLVLARDRLGEKPLYYGQSNGDFLFTSELKALRHYPNWQADIDRDVLASYFRFQYVPAPYCIYKGMHKLLPGHVAVVTKHQDGFEIASERYWCLQEDPLNPHEQNLDAAILEDRLDGLLRDSVRMRLAADVPVGAFLSGGYDSSLVVAVAQAVSSQPVQTFSIGFSEPQFDEAQHAKRVAEHLGTRHTELYVEPEQALATIPSLPDIWCEPFADSSQIPTYLVSKLARQAVTVSLSGDGGDELFYGYSRYFKAAHRWRQIERYPLLLRSALAGMLSNIPDAWLNIAAKTLRPNSTAFSNQIAELARIMAQPDGRLFYRELVSHWKNPQALVLGAQRLEDVFTGSAVEGESLAAMMMRLDLNSYLPDDILVKVDRATMAKSLESRLPLLDHRVVEFAHALPLQFKTDGVDGKLLLKKLTHRYLPAEIMQRPKMGFGVPINTWLRGPLRDWGEALLDPSRIKQQGYLDPVPIQQRWQEHQSGKREWHYYLWDVLMFQAWLEKQAC